MEERRKSFSILWQAAAYIALITRVAVVLPAHLGALTHFSIKCSWYFILRSFNIFGNSSRALKCGWGVCTHVCGRTKKMSSYCKKKYITFVLQNCYSRDISASPYLSSGKLWRVASTTGVASLQPSQQKRLQRCWSCSLGKGGWAHLPLFRSPLHPIFHQFSPLEIRCVWLVAEHINDCSESWLMCSYHKQSASMFHWWWGCDFMWTEWTFLNKIN